MCRSLPAILEELKALADSARAENLPDVASETSALQQRLCALSPRLAEVLRASRRRNEGPSRSSRNRIELALGFETVLPNAAP